MNYFGRTNELETLCQVLYTRTPFLDWLCMHACVFWMLSDNGIV